MKNLNIKKNIWNSGEATWTVSIKCPENSKLSGSSFKRNVFAKKIESYLRGDTDEIKHNGRSYTLNGSKFTSNGKPVLLITDAETDKPVSFYYNNHSDEWRVDYSIQIDESTKFFEDYGYTVDDRR